MKQIFILGAVLSSFFANAQDTFNLSEKNNIVKANVSALAFRNFQFGYERIINKQFSIGANLGLFAKGGIPYIGAFGVDEKLKEVSVGGTTFTLEPRYYVGKKGYGQGFYLAPYYRYAHYKVSDFNLTVDVNQYDIPITLSGTASSHNIGLMIGAQWFLGSQKNWVLDAWFIGAHYGKASGDIHGKTSRLLTAQEQKEVKKELDDLDIPVVKYETSVHANGADMKLDGPWAGVRSGISIGYRF
ncbi:hypothetical protein [Riemerella columbina]|uniref:hypothetical protein n=1 Tax=Riemerella columbina TaxID=103810 RepID=UPI000374EBD1|nr:hypothetical protein [Riemerella columbina]